MSLQLTSPAPLERYSPYGVTLLCDVSMGTQHLYVLSGFRCTIFDSLHLLSHPGIWATQRLFCLVLMLGGGHALVSGASGQRFTAIPQHQWLPLPHKMLEVHHLWPPPTLQWLSISVYLCRPLHALAGGGNPTSGRVDGTGICPRMDLAVWNVIR